MGEQEALKEKESSFQIGVQLIIERDGKVLMGLRGKGFGEGTWGLPGGRVKQGETFLDAGRREALEEHGVKVIEMELVCVVDPTPETNFQPQVLFRAVHWEGEPKKQEVSRCLELGWYNLDELPENIFVASRLALEKYRQGRVY